MFANKRDRETFEQSTVCFRRAIELDPNAVHPHGHWNDTTFSARRRMHRWTGVVESKGRKMHVNVEKIADGTPGVRVDAPSLPPYGNSTLPPAVRSRIVNNINGLAMHLLEAGFDKKGWPCILLLHGFPELAYSWRKMMLPLAAAGYHVVAPDQRGYGRTTGWDDAHDGDPHSLPFLILSGTLWGWSRHLATARSGCNRA